MKQQPFLPFSDDDLYGDHWEYLFLASPPQHLLERIMAVKEDFHATYDHELAIRTWPHITLANFIATRNLEPAITKSIFTACHNHRRFSVGLQDFGGFEPSTIYIKVQEHQPFLKLAKSLHIINEILWTNGSSTAYIVNHPHLTIARRVPYQTYMEAIQEYNHRRFRDVFAVSELKLFRRRNQYDKCQPVTTVWLSSN